MKTQDNTLHSDLVSLKSAAVRLDISLRALYRLIARGTLPRPVKVGGSSKMFNSDIDGYLNASKRNVPNH